MKILKYIWLFITILFILERSTPLGYIHKQTIYILGIISCFGFVALGFIYERKIETLYSIIFGVFIVSCLLSIGAGFFNIVADYKTQEIVFWQKNNPDNKIVYKWQDLGALGYNKSHFKIIRINPVFEWETSVIYEEIDTSKWHEVNEYVNELNLKGG